MLLNEDARLQTFGRVIGKNLDRALQDDRAAVAVLVHEMHRQPRELYAVFDRGAVHVQPVISFAAKARDKGGMNIDDAVGKCPHEIFRHDGEPAREHDIIDAARVQLCNDVLVHRLGIGKVLFTAHDVRNAVLFRTFDGADPRL